MNISETTICPNCRKQTLIFVDYRQGTSVCRECGRVIEDTIIDFTEEIRQFSSETGSEGKSSRLNGGFRNDKAADGGLSLKVSGSTSTVAKMAQRMGVTSEEISTVKSYKLIQQWGSLLGITLKFQRRANEEFNKLVAQKDGLQGYSVESLTAAILYIVCKKCDRPLLPKQISDVTGVSVEDINRDYKHTNQVLGNTSTYIDGCKYSSMLCQDLEANPIVSSAALKIAEKIQESGLLDGKSPRTISAVAVLIAMKLTPNSNITWKKLLEKAHVTEGTIKRGFQIVESHLQDIVPEWENRLPLEKACI